MEVKFDTKNLKYFFPPLLLLKIPMGIYRGIANWIKTTDWSEVGENALVVLAVLFLIGYPILTISMFATGHWIIGLILAWVAVGFLWWVNDSEGL